MAPASLRRRLDEPPVGTIDSGALDLDPRYVRPGKGWTPQMIEMADHIGAFRTLLISQALGGRQIYIPADSKKNRLGDIVGEDAARTLSRVYRRERIVIPTARAALRSARRAGILARVRRGELNISEAARRLGSWRTYVSYLINHTDEGLPVATPMPSFAAK